MKLKTTVLHTHKKNTDETVIRDSHKEKSSRIKNVHLDELLPLFFKVT